MRTRRSTVTFKRPFVLNRVVGELPAGSYDLEIDEEEFGPIERTGYRRTAIYFYVHQDASTRMIAVAPADLDSAVERDEP